MYIWDNEEDYAPQHQQQQMLLMPVEAQTYARIEGQYSVRLTNDSQKLIIASPAFLVDTNISVKSLPRNVQPGDHFGWLQTIFESKSKAWYKRIDSPGQAWAQWPNRPFMTLAERTGAIVGDENIPFKILKRTIKDLPACDRGEDPIFYDPPLTFAETTDPNLAKLLGGKTKKELIKPPMMDKPQDTFPVATPCGNGRLYRIKGCFVATAWLVAMRNQRVIHFFHYVDWRLDYSGTIDKHANFHGAYYPNITAQGPGKGGREPVIGGIPADDFDQRAEYEWRIAN